MGVGITILSGMFFGILSGIGIVIAYFYFKTWRENKKVLKINPDIVKEIELNKKSSKKILNDREKNFKEIRERSREQNGFTRREQNTSGTNEYSSDKEHSPERLGRVSVSEVKDNARHSKFTLRD